MSLWQQEKNKASGSKSIDWEVGFCREESKDARRFSNITKADGAANKRQDRCGERAILGFGHADSALGKDKGLALWLCHHFLPGPRSGLDLLRKP